MIAAANSPPALAAKAATTTVPIIFISPEDPVRLGLVASLAKPGGNLSGINLLIGELVAKRLELLRELLPQIVRVAVLVNPANPSTTETALRMWCQLLALWDFKLRPWRPAPVVKIDAAFATLAREQSCGLFVSNDPFSLPGAFKWPSSRRIA